jgi:hypothetical protein
MEFTEGMLHSLSSTDIERAYLYFFDDKDEAQLHGASGITRNYKPKPSFYAMSHLYKSLDDYHFAKAVLQREGDVYCFQYDRADAPAEHIFVVWRPTGDAEIRHITLPFNESAGKIYKTERMPLSAEKAEKVNWKKTDTGIDIEGGPLPVFIWTK